MTDPLPTVAGRTRGTRPVRRPGAWRLLGILLAAVLLVAAPAVPAAEPTPEATAGDAPAGWIEDFAGPSAEYLLTRRGQPLAVYPLMQILPGDLIRVRYPGGRLSLHLGETDTLDLDQAHSPYAVPAGGRVPSLGGNLMRWADRLFAGMPEAQARTVPLAGRGDEAAWPDSPVSGLLGPDTRLAEGSHPLALAWRGGQAPYRVRLAPAGDEAPPVVDLTGLTEPRCEAPDITLTPGDWVLSITDDAGRTLATGIAVVPAVEVPWLDPAELPPGLPDSTAQTLTAAWLAGQGDGRTWRLEAYRQVADLGDDAAADWLRRALQAGEPLPRPLGQRSEGRTECHRPFVCTDREERRDAMNPRSRPPTATEPRGAWLGAAAQPRAVDHGSAWQ